MKIRVEFNEVEKQAIMAATECNNNSDVDEKVKGGFGIFEYNSKENYIDIKLAENFILDTATFINRYIEIIKSFINLSNDFISKWFKLEDEKFEDESNIHILNLYKEKFEEVNRTSINDESYKDLINELLDLYNKLDDESRERYASSIQHFKEV